MQEFVVDANVLISILISGKSSYKLILTYLDLFTPDFALEEIEKYKSVIFEKSKLNADELRQFTFHVFNQIAVVPSFVISDEAILKATCPWHRHKRCELFGVVYPAGSGVINKR